MSEWIELWRTTPELRKLFGNGLSFAVWYGQNIHPLANPTIEEVIKKAKKRFLCGNDRVKFNKRHNITSGKWMGDLDIFIGIGIIGILCIAIYFGVGLFATFYNFEDYDGDLDIDTDSMEDLSEEIEETGEVIFENYDTDRITTASGSIAVIIGIIAGCAVIAYILLR